MAHPHPHPPQPIPKVEFKLVTAAPSAPPDVQNSQAASYGFNDGKEWNGGDTAVEGRYIRYLRESSLVGYRVVHYRAVQRQRAGTALFEVSSVALKQRSWSSGKC